MPTSSFTPIGMSPHRLHLVLPDVGPNLVQARAMAHVERENHAAAAMARHTRDPDLHQILAMRAAQALEGGRAAIMPPARRRGIVDLATKMGMSPFQANLIIAVVQDGARRGQNPAHKATSRVLALIPGPARAAKSGPVRTLNPHVAEVARLALAALLLAGIAVVMLINWVVG